jgi:hypothetical protein
MPLKAEYLATVEITSATYGSATSAVERICEIYHTARKGRLSTAHGTQLWTAFFTPLLRQLSAFPKSQIHYDKLAIRRMERLANLLRSNGLGDFGIAQKMYNLFLKDHWALNAFPSQIENLLHLPLDRITLSKFKKPPAPWTAWTKIKITSANRKQVLGAYAQIQKSFRAYWKHLKIKRIRRFASPIEMEQFIWHRLELKAD